MGSCTFPENFGKQIQLAAAIAEFAQMLTADLLCLRYAVGATGREMPPTANVNRYRQVNRLYRCCTHGGASSRCPSVPVLGASVPRTQIAPSSTCPATCHPGKAGGRRKEVLDHPVHFALVIGHSGRCGRGSTVSGTDRIKPHPNAMTALRYGPPNLCSSAKLHTRRAGEGYDRAA
jgi:hypothetical protein